MIPSASLTPPIGYVNKDPIAPDGATRQRSAIDGTGAVGAVTRTPGRDPSPHRHVPMPSKAQPGDAATSRDEGFAAPSDRGVTDAGSAVRESEALTLRRVLDIRARSETAELVELPVPVTEILRISMNVPAADPVAGINARSLYEGMQGVFARDVPASARTAPETTALRAA